MAVEILRAVALGGSVRVDWRTQDGRDLEAKMDREAWRALGLIVGDAAIAAPRTLRVFPANPGAAVAARH